MSAVLTARPIKRCAVYTRKSTDEGLDQEFTSLDAQFESGCAYIASQRHEGWTLCADRYDDPDYSGGSLNRPSLKRLMIDIESGKIDIIVVYKIDRLTRSLKDFVALADVFDRHGAAFVSVTQQFNTATAMGRLILNILLAFAQFERENGAERVRDKIAASKKKGLWMGGVPPLGYDVQDRRLVINEREAALVRDIFERFLKHGCSVRLVSELSIEGKTTKSWVTQSGKQRLGGAIDKQFIYKLLRNRVYVGELMHRDKIYPAQHQAILPRPLWDQVHAVLATNATAHGNQARVQTCGRMPALLRGLLFGQDGDPMYPTYTRRRGKLYRYYLAKADRKFGHGTTQMRMLPAGEIEDVIMVQVRTALAAPELAVAVLQQIERADPSMDETHVVLALKRLTGVWDQLFVDEQNRLLHLLIQRVQISRGGVDIVWRDGGFAEVSAEFADHPFVREQREAATA